MSTNTNTNTAADTRPEWAKTRVSAQLWPLVQAASRAMRQVRRARGARARKVALARLCAAQSALDAARGITHDPFQGRPSDGWGDCVFL